MVLEKFRCVNTLIGNVKTALTGTYHAIRFAKYAYRYLAEVQFRLNRRYNMPAMLGCLLRALVTTPTRPERKIRVAEFHRKSGARLGSSDGNQPLPIGPVQHQT